VQKLRQQETKIRDAEFLKEYYDAEENNYANRKIDDVRKQRLTLKHLNRLRKQREVHNVEHANRTKRVKKIYARPAAT